MDPILCMVDNCDAAPTERVTLDSSGMYLVYAVCADHFVAIVNSQMFAEAAEVNRGLIGLA